MSFIFGGDSAAESDDEITSNNPWNVMSQTDENVPEESNESIEFKKSIVNAKYKLYVANVFPSNENADDKDKIHSIELLKKYRNDLNNFYIYSVKLQNRSNHNDAIDLSIFPEETRDSIQLALNIVKSFFSKNSIPETIPYTNFIKSSLHTFPYVQNAMDNDEDNTNNEEIFSG